MRISSRPKHSAAVCESLTSQPDGRVELRPHVLQADDCGELDELCRITVGPQPLHKLVVNGGRRRGHGLGVLYDQALQRLNTSLSRQCGTASIFSRGMPRPCNIQ
jgi:hypothetical protein